RVSRRKRVPPRSAIAPSSGANTAMARLARPLARPKRKVLTVGSAPTLQYCLKNTGKKPAMTVVAKAELAQSYSAQARTGRRRKGVGMAPYIPADGLRSDGCERPDYWRGSRPLQSFGKVKNRVLPLRYTNSRS